MRSLLLLLLLLLAGCSSGQRHTPQAALLDGYAPGVVIGARAKGIARAFGLSCYPYVGYADSTYSTRDGLRGLWLALDPPPASETDCPGRGARVEAVQFMVPSAESEAAVERRLASALGEPTLRYCFRRFDGRRVHLGSGRATTEIGACS